MARNAVVNTRRWPLLRTTVPSGENLAGLVLVCVLAAVVLWVAGQREAFDPERRDLPPEMLAGERPVIEIYDRPLKPWVEPGTIVAGAAPALDLGMFPPTVADAEWQPAGRVRSFDADNLYEKINGEAEKFIKQGFRALDYLVLRSARDGTELAIELYDHGDRAGSLGIFTEHVSGDRTVEQQGEVSYFTTSAGVIGRAGRHFFRAAADRDGEAVERKAGALIDAFAALGEPSGQDDDVPAGLAILTRAGFSEADITFQSANVFQFDFASEFWFARIEGEAQVFVHVAQSDDAATTLFEAIVEEQGYEYEALDDDAEGGAATFRHGFLSTYFVIARDGPYVFGLDNLADPEGIRTGMGRIAGSLGE